LLAYRLEFFSKLAGSWVILLALQKQRNKNAQGVVVVFNNKSQALNIETRE